MSSLPRILMWWYWDPQPEAFRLPWIDRPVLWYGILFVLGFILGYLIFIPLLKRELKRDPSFDSSRNVSEESTLLADRLMWYVIIGALVGARLGHVFLYNWPSYRDHLIDIFKTWEGGLASHGGAVGVLIALGLFRYSISIRYPRLTFITLLDLICVPTALVGFMIRIGNMMNQEILGLPTTMPWGVIFGHPADASPSQPRHPVQLYEAFAYLAIFIFLYVLWKRFYEKLPTGTISGLFFISVFGSRFFLENYKAPQSFVFNEGSWKAGQLLSVPLIFFGCALLLYAYCRGCRNSER